MGRGLAFEKTTQESHQWVQGVSPSGQLVQSWIYTNSVLAVVALADNKFAVVRVFEDADKEIFETREEAMTYVEDLLRELELD